MKLLAFLVVIEFRCALLGELPCVVREGSKGITSLWGVCVERLQLLPRAIFVECQVPHGERDKWV